MSVRTLVVAAVLSSSAALAPGQEVDTAHGHRSAAFDAYNSARYPECAAAFEQAARAASGVAAANDFYNAGCCHAMAGNTDAAFTMLRLAVEAGYANYNRMSSDTDLDSLHGDPRLDTLLERIKPPPIVITDDVRRHADEAEFVYDDAENFVRAMRLVSSGADLVTTLETEYFAKGTAGLAQMVTKYPFTAADLAAAIERYPEDYERIAGNLEMLKRREAEFRDAYRRYERIAPDTVFPPTYFLVDRHRGIGSGSPDGQLITIETRTDESIGRIETLLIHELVHFQQLVATGPDEFYAIFGPKKTLLALTVREGTAEFLADLATGRMTQQDAVEYCLTHESATWERFRQSMSGRATDGWMWSTPDDPAIPRDLAYVLGARIVKSYYDRAADKHRAVREILAVIDYPAFLAGSGYGDRFPPAEVAPTRRP